MSTEKTSPEEIKAKDIKRKLVGIIANDRHILAWNYEYGLDICVTADKDDSDGSWCVNASRNHRTVFSGLSYGSKWQASCLVKFIRNGLVSRAMKLKKKCARRRKTDNPVNPVNPVKTTTKEAQA